MGLIVVNDRIFDRLVDRYLQQTPVFDLPIRSNVRRKLDLRIRMLLAALLDKPLDRSHGQRVLFVPAAKQFPNVPRPIAHLLYSSR